MAETLDLKTRLTLRLAELFVTDDEARTIAGHANLSLIRIEFDGPAAVIWTNIVRQAVLEQRVAQLIVCAQATYENDAILREAGEALAADAHVFDLPEPEESEVETKSRAPQQILTTVVVLLVVIVAVDRLDLSIVARVALIAVAFPLVLPLLRRVFPSTGAAAPHPTAESTSAMAEIDYDSGIFGGLAGGLVTGALLSVVYNKWTTRPIPLVKLLPLVTAFFGIAVAALGWLVAVLTSWFARLQRSAWIFNEITACLAAGVLAGLLSGPAIAWHFGKHQKDWDFAGPAILLAGIVPGCVIVGIFIATWDQWPLSRRLMRSIITSTIAAWIIGLTAGAVSDATGLKDWLYHQLYDAGTPGGRLQGGVIYGLIIGTVSGLVIGVSLALSRRWPSRVIAATRLARPPAGSLAE